MNIRKIGGAVAALAVAASLAACSSSSSANQAGSKPETSAPKALVSLPAAFDGKNLLEPAITGYPPYSFLQGTTLTGIEPDLVNGYAATLGRKITQQQDSFENALLGLSSGKYFLLMGADVTAARLKTYDMVPFIQDFYQFTTTASHDSIGPNLSDLCGLKISAVAASSSLPVLSQQSAACTASGKPAITTLTFADQPTCDLAVQSGRADATTSSITNLGYTSKLQPGKWKISGPTYGHIFIGAASLKGNGVAQSVADGINAMIASGEYLKILTKYGVQDSAITKSVLNADPDSAK